MQPHEVLKPCLPCVNGSKPWRRMAGSGLFKASVHPCSASPPLCGQTAAFRHLKPTETSGPSALLVLRLPGDETFIPAYFATLSWEYPQRGRLSFSGTFGCVILIEHLAPFAGELLGLLCCYVPSIFSNSPTCVLRARCEGSVLQVKPFESRVNPSVRRSSPACIAAEKSALRGRRLR